MIALLLLVRFFAKKSIIQIKNQMQKPYLHDATIRLSTDTLKPER